MGATGVVPPPAVRHALRSEPKEASTAIGKAFEAARQTNSEARLVEWCRLLVLDSGLRLPETGTHLEMLRTSLDEPAFQVSVAVRAVVYYTMLTCMLPLFMPDRHMDLLRGMVTGAIAPARVKGDTTMACPRRASRRQPSIIG